MFKESKPLSCEARQISDQLRCEKCNLLWDMNDPEPPTCKTGKDLFNDQREILRKKNGELECYRCGVHTTWLAPDSRCGKCTNYTPVEIRGEV